MELTTASESYESETTYEAPRVEDYGTLAELTAGNPGGGTSDVVFFFDIFLS